MAQKILNKQSGFTLLEMSLTLGIIALVAGVGLSFASSAIEEERKELTEKRMTYVMLKIQQYADEKNQLPCPATGNIAANNIDFGIGIGTGAAGVCTEQNTDVVGNILSGMVPFATLGIHPIYALDGWNRKFTYVVDEDLTFPGTDGVNGYLDVTNPTNGDIQIQDESNVSVTGSENAAIVLISHGKNGHGAWPAKGTTRINATNEGTHEIDNDPSNVLNPAIFRQATYREQAQRFDDLVVYRTAWQLRN